MRGQSPERRRRQSDLTGEQPGNRRSRAAVGNMQQLDAGGVGEGFHRYMGGTEIARGAEGNHARALLGVCDQIVQRPPGCRRLHGENIRIRQHAGHRYELVELVQGRTVMQPFRFRRDDDRAQRDEERMPVRLRLRDRGSTDRPARARPIFDDDGTPHQPLERQGDGTRRQVRLSARRKRHDQADVARRPLALGVSPRRRRQRRSERSADRCRQEPPTVHLQGRQEGLDAHAPPHTLMVT